MEPVGQLSQVEELHLEPGPARRHADSQTKTQGGSGQETQTQGGRERLMEKERETETQGGRQRHREKEREIETQGEGGRQRHREGDRDTGRKRGR